MDKTYDQYCHDLARAFLSDAGFTDPKLIHQLAQEVQQTVEDFVGDLERDRDAQQSQSEPSQSTDSTDSQSQS